MGDFSTCVTWVKRGLIHGIPEKVTLSREEIQEIINSRNDSAYGKIESSEENDSESDNSDPYDFEHYDDDPGDCDFNIESIASYTSQDCDPYINIPGMDDDDSDEEDDIIKPTDNLIITGNGWRGDNESGVLDVIVYNFDDGDTYPHHDINLLSCPFSVEVIPLDSSEHSSAYVAAGQLNSTIEIHDLHIMNPVTPIGNLGSKKTPGDHFHSDAVLSLAWNPSFNHILASGAADKKVLLWDLETLSVSVAFEDFKDVIESLKWSPNSPETLLTCSSSKYVSLLDGRCNEVIKRWQVKDKAVIAEWASNSSNHFVVGTSEGSIYKFDVRESEKVWWTNAHETSLSGLNVVSSCSDILITADSVGEFSVWNLNPFPRNIYSNHNNVETLTALSLNPDFPHIGCMVGSKKKGKFFKEFNISKMLPASVYKT